MGYPGLNSIPETMTLLDRLSGFFRQTPLHPQWLAIKGDHFRFILEMEFSAQERLLDIGCGKGELKNRLPDDVSYLGFDYPATGIERYHAEPDILGSAEALPLAENSVDVAVCLEVMEHLPDPVAAAGEIARVLRPGGRAVVSVPFAYPIHDAPFDFQRMTSYQLVHMFESSGLRIELLQETGHALESAALLANLALAKTVLDQWAIAYF